MQRPLKRSRSGSLSKSMHATPNKGKGKEVVNQDISQILSDLEDEMTCPMYAAVSPLGLAHGFSPDVPTSCMSFQSCGFRCY